MDDAPKPGTGRLGRGARSAQPVTWREIRTFAATDFARRISVLLAGLLSVVVLTSGWIRAVGLPEATSGLFRPDLTPLSPASIAHAIWGPALGLVVVYAVWVWLPWSRHSRRVEATAYPATASILLLAAWLWAVEEGRFRTSLILVVAVWLALVWALRRSARVRSVGFFDRQVTQLPFAVLLGWMTVMGAVTLGLVARHKGIRPWQVPSETWWVLGVVLLLAVSMSLVRYLPGRAATAGAIAWGFLTIAYGRVLGEPRAYVVAIACLVSALLILVAAVTVVMWFRSRKRF